MTVCPKHPEWTTGHVVVFDGEGLVCGFCGASVSLPTVTPAEDTDDLQQQMPYINGVLHIPIPPGAAAESLAEDMRHNFLFRKEELGFCDTCGCAGAKWLEICDCTSETCGCREHRLENE